MNSLSVIEKSKDILKNTIYNMIYGRKFKKLHIDKSFSSMLIERSSDAYEADILKLISQSKNQADFESNILNHLKSSNINPYANTLLIGNLTGNYVFNNFYFEQIDELNINAFSQDNSELLQHLENHFYEYIINNNKRKNTFAEKANSSSVRDLSQDLNEENLTNNFEKVLNGEELEINTLQINILNEYIIKTIGTYSKEDIT